MTVFTLEDISELKKEILGGFRDRAMEQEVKWVEKTAINTCTQIVINKINEMIEKEKNGESNSN